MSLGRRVLAGLLPMGLLGCPPNDTSDFAGWLIEDSGYEIEVLPTVICASYARGDDVYLGLLDGRILKASDSRLSDPWTDLGNPFGTGPRLLFTSSAGVVFTGADRHPVYRTTDGGQTWTVSLNTSVWRMDEDDQGHLYAGNYTQDEDDIATVYKSLDGGATWTAIWTDPLNRHVHTVRWDDVDRRLYIAFGDGALRGRACSDDHGTTFHDLARNYRDGPADVACTTDYVLWGSDNGSGELWRVSRATGAETTLLGNSQYLWFTVAGGAQVFVGTVTSAEAGGERAVLLASSDQGATWVKLLETEASTGPYSHGFSAESRELSGAGWLYCTGGAAGAGTSYRVRLRSSPP